MMFPGTVVERFARPRPRPAPSWTSSGPIRALGVLRARRSDRVLGIALVAIPGADHVLVAGLGRAFVRP